VQTQSFNSIIVANTLATFHFWLHKQSVGLILESTKKHPPVLPSRVSTLGTIKDFFQLDLFLSTFDLFH
jgi:hypothetical protein